MLDPALGHDLSVCGTFFVKREWQKVTSKIINTILLVRDVKVVPGEDVAPHIGLWYITIPLPSKSKYEPNPEADGGNC